MTTAIRKTIDTAARMLGDRVTQLGAAGNLDEAQRTKLAELSFQAAGKFEELLAVLDEQDQFEQELGG